MDAFKEMIEIEKKFGAIPLGVPKPKYHNVQRNLNPNESKSLWGNLAESCLYKSPAKFKEFLEIINRATIEKDSIIELHKRKILNDFLSEKNVTRSKE